MDHKEEQVNELEALSEIYFDEIKVISDKQPISFSILVRSQVSSFDEQDNPSDDDESLPEKAELPNVELLFELPEKYPDVKPTMEALNYSNLDEDDIAELMSNLESKADESIGSVMIFILVSDVVEWLSSIAEREKVEIEREKTRRLEELEAEERRKAEGTPVTVESFLAWKAKFDAELLKKKLELQKRQMDQNPSGQKRLTGREMFESDKALAESDLNFVDELEQDQIEALMQKIDDVDFGDDGEEFILGSDDDDSEGASETELTDSDDASD